MRLLYALEANNKLRQLAKEFGRQKRVVVKYNMEHKYVHIYDNRKRAKYPWITLGYDEFQEFRNIVDSFFKTKVFIYLFIFFKSIFIKFFFNFTTLNFKIFSVSSFRGI